MPTTHSLNLCNLEICGLFSGSPNWLCFANSFFRALSYTPTASIGFTSNWVCFAIFDVHFPFHEIEIENDSQFPSKALLIKDLNPRWLCFVIRVCPLDW